MKASIIALLIISTYSLSINTKCLGELTKLTPRFAQLYTNVRERKLTTSTKELIGILKSLAAVKNSCSGQEGMDILSFTSKVGVCLQGGYELAVNAYKSYNEFEEDGFSDILVDSLVEMSHLVEPVILNCWGEEIKSALSVVLPKECVDQIDGSTKVALKIIEQKERPLMVTKGLLQLQKIFQQAQISCPYIKDFMPKKEDEDEDEDFALDMLEMFE